MSDAQYYPMIPLHYYHSIDPIDRRLPVTLPPPFWGFSLWLFSNMDLLKSGCLHSSCWGQMLKYTNQAAISENPVSSNISETNQIRSLKIVSIIRF